MADTVVVGCASWAAVHTGFVGSEGSGAAEEAYSAHVVVAWGTGSQAC